MAKFELDIANDITVNETIENLKATIENANVIKVIENGPAGGWPVFLVEVPEKEVAALMKWYLGEDDGDIEEFMETYAIA